MRVIESKMIEAIENGNNMSVSNTEVSHTNGKTFVRLFGNLIATINGDTLTISNCGWDTNTTKSRLNAILGHYNLPLISQAKRKWYQNNKPFVSGAKFKI